MFLLLTRHFNKVWAMLVFEWNAHARNSAHDTVVFWCVPCHVKGPSNRGITKWDKEAENRIVAEGKSITQIAMWDREYLKKLLQNVCDLF